MAYVQKIYAGFLGMNIGIRLGAPVEPALWSYERIRDTYGDIRGYVKDYKHFAADDDANGPVFFLRALDDHAGEPTAQAVAEAWLNYAREGVGLYWWGGYGISTEHTAYLNLKNGVPAPQSGSIRQNGKTLAEQIGGQIFIDTWGLVVPADPARAARYARAAASVSHDGEGLNGAAFIAACISKAFETADIDAIMDAGLAQIPRESVYAAVVEAVRAFHRANPHDWRACRAMLEAEWGYDRYGGVCHIIPNAGVCALAMCYGAGNFARTVEIATMCSWDTDCNAGNVGTILGVACGLEGLPAHYRDPINDEIVLSGISGYLNILDIPSYAWELARWGYLLRGEPVPEEVSGRVREGEVYFDFSLPGSTHGLRFACDVPTCARLRDGSVLLDRMVRGQKAKLFYKPFWRRADFSDERYMPVFSPRAYTGQQVEMRLRYEKLAGELLILTPYVRNSLSGAE
ncbi:MAG: ADP-ribosylglycohydrolase family protein, partial [Clostridiales bacterium]|nr:ADP-ribosylglycohydrolase family protein [Clostridiales bacterium]